MARLVPAHPQLGLFIVGHGEERPRLEQLARRWNIHNNVVFLGFRNGVKTIMESADAFVQASSYEGYGRTLVEAAQARLPIVTSDVGIVGEVFTPDRSVLAFEPGDVDALTRHIARLMADATLRAELVEQASADIERHLASLHGTPIERLDHLLELAARDHLRRDGSKPA